MEWSSFTIDSNGRPGAAGYIKDDRQGAWSRGMLVQTGDGADDPQLERCLFRLNIQKKDWGIKYETHRNLARRGIEATDYAASTVLLRGKADDPIGGMTKMYLGRLIGFDPNMEWKRVEPEKYQGNARPRPGVPLEDLAKLRIQLEQELEKNTGPRQDPEKTDFNFSDSSSILEGAALADGVKPWETRHLRLEEGGGTAGKNVVLSQERDQTTPEVLEEHGGPAKQKVLAEECEGIREQERK